ncbi:DsbA family protein [Pseudonocardia humida]|uniref:Thioredoxin domain-containing protein n=1 Tax=Pseudonocardia humida TaxID=2800819 RepID=A0ABT0ZTZ8_9PSEU|nr:thioredoxin domain-containing protein [Pseudonocardia humida]MCO1654149.1 thioredoxin domain-containing protein [Pseudonocardia humida]
MGGAARNEKRRKQDEAARKLAAAGIKVERKTGPNRTAIIMVAVVVVFALLVGGFIFWQRSSSSADVVASYPVAVSGAVVTAGSGPVVVDTYEDYLCPQCERFETRYGDEIKTALNEGRITVKYHAIAILDRLTEPQGYSTRAANAALCAAAANIFPGYHEKLFAEQPAEGGSGLTDEQLVAFGTELGAGPDFGTCVTGGANSAAVGAETEKAAADQALQTEGTFGTPTVTVNGKKIDLNDTSWLQSAIGA